MIKVRAHTCYLGHSGYSAHAREFFRNLSNHVDLRIRNYTWDGNPTYLNDKDFKIIDKITLRNTDGKDEDFPITHSFPQYHWANVNRDFNPDVDIVLMDMDHYYFYEEYDSKIRIAYTVWESTEIPQAFFNQLLKFDYLWVATEWHKEVVVEQGYPKQRVFVVNEGVSSEFFGEFKLTDSVKKEYEDQRFKFLFFGRWDYRKAVPEVIDSFLKAFPNNEPVDLILSADNPYAIDGMNTTEERLAHYGYTDDRIKVKHFVSREDYVAYLKTGNVLITCARSEGWNIPLIEAMAAGTPVIYSDWGAQLEFAYGKGNPVKIKEELPANIGAKLGFAGNTPGLYAEPDFSDLSEVIKDCYLNYDKRKECAELEKNYIISNFNWENIGKKGYETLLRVSDFEIPKSFKKEAAVVLSHANSKDKLDTLTRCVISLKRQGYFVILSSHISVPDNILNLVDYFVCELDNPVVGSEEYSELSNTVPIYRFNYAEFSLSYTFDFNHGFAALRLIQNGINIALQNGYEKTHFVNYDYIIDDYDVLDYHSVSLETNNIVTYKWNPEESINSALFSARTKDLVDAVGSTKSKRDYFRYSGVVILEDFLYQCFKDLNFKMDIRESSLISSSNFLNGFMTPAFPTFLTKSGEQAHIYLGEDQSSGNNYLCLLGGSKEVNMEVKTQTDNYRIKANDSMKFYRVSNDMLEKGFKVVISEYDQVYEYHKGSKKASVEIRIPQIINDFVANEPKITFHFVEGPFIEIKDAEGQEFFVEFIDGDTGKLEYSTNVGNNTWSRCSIKYFKNWIIRATEINSKKVYEHNFDLKGKNALISLGSSSLGDTLAWFPHIEEFAKKHECKVYVSTFKNSLFENNYPDINFVSPGTGVNNIYASYEIGWFYHDERFDLYKNPRDFKDIPLQATTTDILGLDHSDLRPRLVIPDLGRRIEEPYVCIGIHSTAQAKYWNNPTGWQEVTDWFISKGYKVVMLSLEEDGYMGNYYPKGVIGVEGEKTLANAMNYLKYSHMFIGIGSGLSWLSWSVGTPTVIISGFSNPITEPTTENVIRIFNSKTCTSCFNRYRLDAGDWNWCPDQKGTDRQFECTKSITGEHVINEIEKYFKLGYSEKSLDSILHESLMLGMVQNYSEIRDAAEFFKSLDVENFMEIGTDQGGTFAIWSKLSRDGIRISVDLPHGHFGKDNYDVNKRDNYLRSLGSNVKMIHGSSHDEEIKARVSEIIGDKKLDFLFIDGDHTYEGVKKDFIMYKEFVKPGGWVGFHDTIDSDHHRNANCRVDLLWNELQGEKIDFVCGNSTFGGIGFIKV
jgi:autotransporter strand-loop-strand O-heptosyltransferase